ncbi:hypothetical protein C8J56DRAFT_1040436 [Mycena floridula]|nr:hypothetical protein C8J56DRAFT_1040436 [Mycena floridula]
MVHRESAVERQLQQASNQQDYSEADELSFLVHLETYPSSLTLVRSAEQIVLDFMTSILINSESLSSSSPKPKYLTSSSGLSLLGCRARRLLVQQIPRSNATDTRSLGLEEENWAIWVKSRFATEESGDKYLGEKDNGLWVGLRFFLLALLFVWSFVFLAFHEQLDMEILAFFARRVLSSSCWSFFRWRHDKGMKMMENEKNMLRQMESMKI